MLRVTTERTELVRGLSRVSHVTTKNTTNPLASTVKISTVLGEEASGLEFYAADGVGFASTTALADVSSPGEVVVSAAQLERIMAVLPDAGVMLTENEKTLSISSGAHKRFRIPLLGVPYPNPAIPYEGNLVTVPAAALEIAIARVEVCRGQSIDTPHLNGVMLESAGRGIKSVGLSGHRAAISYYPLGDREPLPVPWSCFIPDRLLRSVHDLCREADEISISHDNAIYFSTRDTMIGCAVAAQAFPGYAFLTQEPFPKLLRLRTADLLDAIRAVLASSTGSGISMKMWTEDGKLQLESVGSVKDADEVAESGDAVEPLEIEGPISPPFYAPAAMAREVIKQFGEEVWIGCSDRFLTIASVEGKLAGHASGFVCKREEGGKP